MASERVINRVAWRVCDMVDGPCLCRATADATGAEAVCDRFRLGAEAIVILVRETDDETPVRRASGPDAR